MQKTGLVLSLFAVATLTGGCESARKAFGSKKSPPDEFVVYSRPPLSLPPDYGLRPPTPGISRPQRIEQSKIAREAMLGQTSGQGSAQNLGNTQQETASTPGLQALLRDTGAVTANSDIRSTINQETSILAQEDDLFVNKLIFWVDSKHQGGTVLDPEAESKRLREAEALGQSTTETETIHVRRKPGKKGLLDF